MRTLLVLSVSASLVLAIAGQASAAKSHRRSLQNFRGAHGAVIAPGADVAPAPGVYRYPGYGPIPPQQNRNLDPSNWGGG